MLQLGAGIAPGVLAVVLLKENNQKGTGEFLHGHIEASGLLSVHKPVFYWEQNTSICRLILAGSSVNMNFSFLKSILTNIIPEFYTGSLFL